jgi:hypothetical protein
MNPHLPPGCTSAEIEKRFGDPRTREDAGLCEDCGKPLDDFGACRGECYEDRLERRVSHLEAEKSKLSHGSTPERVSSPPCNSRGGLTVGEVISGKP